MLRRVCFKMGQLLQDGLSFPMSSIVPVSVSGARPDSYTSRWDPSRLGKYVTGPTRFGSYIVVIVCMSVFVLARNILKSMPWSS